MEIIFRIPIVKNMMKRLSNQLILTESTDEWYIYDKYFNDVKRYVEKPSDKIELGLLGGRPTTGETISLNDKLDTGLLTELDTKLLNKLIALDDMGIEDLILAGADINCRHPVTACTPLHIAAASGCKRTIRKLLQFEDQIDFDAVDWRKRDAPYFAEVHGRESGIAELLRRKQTIRPPKINFPLEP